jgi:hypothetical protein
MLPAVRSPQRNNCERRGRRGWDLTRPTPLRRTTSRLRNFLEGLGVSRMQEERKDHGWILEVRVRRRQARYEAPQDWHAQERQKRQDCEI